jgi:hypothetical protein
VNPFERMLRNQMRARRRPVYGWRRPRRRTNVRVGGCCLPIPLGVMTAGALGVRLATGRRDD